MPDLTTAELTVLDMLAQSNTPWVRRSLVDLVAGRGAVDGLVEAKLVEFWTTGSVAERKLLPNGTWAIKPRETPTTFAALTALGQAVTSRDTIERSDCGQPCQAHRRKSEKGVWMLPDSPFKSHGGGGAIVCPDIASGKSGEQGDHKVPPAPSTRRERRAKRAG